MGPTLRSLGRKLVTNRHSVVCVCVLGWTHTFPMPPSETLNFCCICFYAKTDACEQTPLSELRPQRDQDRSYWHITTSYYHSVTKIVAYGDMPVQYIIVVCRV